MAELHPVYIINISIKDFGTVEFCLRAQDSNKKTYQDPLFFKFSVQTMTVRVAVIFIKI